MQVQGEGGREGRRFITVGGEKSGTAAPQPQTQLDIPLRVHGAGAEGGSPPQGPWFCPSCYSWFKDESITWDKAVLPSNTLGRVSEQGLGGNWVQVIQAP